MCIRDRHDGCSDTIPAIEGCFDIEIWFYQIPESFHPGKIIIHIKYSLAGHRYVILCFLSSGFHFVLLKFSGYKLGCYQSFRILQKHIVRPIQCREFY